MLSHPNTTITSNETTPTSNSEDVFEITQETLRQLENDSEKFQEGLATSDNSMTDEVPNPESNETNPGGR